MIIIVLITLYFLFLSTYSLEHIAFFTAFADFAFTI